jgi:hypothetical protein
MCILITLAANQDLVSHSLVFFADLSDSAVGTVDYQTAKRSTGRAISGPAAPVAEYKRRISQNGERA